MSGSFDGARFAAASRYHTCAPSRAGRPLATGQRAGNENRCPVGRAVFVAAVETRRRARNRGRRRRRAASSRPACISSFSCSAGS
jgi:hypothetical protein